jgi:hypothetical protein
MIFGEATKLFPDVLRFRPSLMEVGFASKVTTCTWTGSVPPAVAGGSMFSVRYKRGFWGSTVFTPPATADGTDPVQEHFWTFEAKPWRCT